MSGPVNETSHALLAERFESVCEGLREALRTSGRDASSLKLVAVSKTHPAETAEALVRIWRDSAFPGPPALGENYVQEAVDKQSVVDGRMGEAAPQWHFIGHIQSRKARDVAGRFACIHTVDSEKLGRELDKRLAVLPAYADGAKQEILVQVNVGREPQKAGVLPENAANLLEALQQMPRLAVMGLMCIPPFGNGAEISRPHFVALRELRDKLSAQTGLALAQLSMGMSHDYKVAVAEGATLVRIGTDIFGERP